MPDEHDQDLLGVTRTPHGEAEGRVLSGLSGMFMIDGFINDWQTSTSSRADHRPRLRLRPPQRSAIPEGPAKAGHYVPHRSAKAGHNLPRAENPRSDGVRLARQRCGWCEQQSSSVLRVLPPSRCRPVKVEARRRTTHRTAADVRTHWCGRRCFAPDSDRRCSRLGRTPLRR